MISRRDFLKFSGIAALAEVINWECPAQAKTRRAGSSEYDAIIIGAGLGGLSCAAFLTRSGFRPLVIEKHYKPGGYATSFRRSGDGKTFNCEVSLHAMAGSPQNEQLLRQLGVWGKITLVPYANSWYSMYPDFTLSLPVCDFDCLEGILAQEFPHEAAGLSDYMDCWEDLLADTESLLDWPSFTFDFASRYPTLWDMRDKTLADLQDEYFQDQKLKAVLSQSWAYYGLPPSQLPSWYYLMPTGYYYTKGPYYIAGTSQGLSNALVEVIRDGGGEVILGTMVTEVIVENKRAIGVKTEDGERYYGNAVVSNAAVPQTFGELVPESEVPHYYQEKLSHYRPSLSTFIVWLGLNRDITNEIPWESCAFYTGYNPDEAYQRALAGDLENSGFGITVYDKVVDGFSPVGYTSATLITVVDYEPWKQFEADYFAGNKEAYNEEKDRLTESLIARAEEYVLPGLSQMIVMKDASTPLTNVRYTLNTGGAILGYAQTMNNSGMYRLKNRTPIRGLYLSGAWSFPSGGYEAVLLSGKYTFKNIIKDWLWGWVI